MSTMTTAIHQRILATGALGISLLVTVCPASAEQTFECREADSGRTSARIVGGSVAHEGSWRWQVALEMDTPGFKGQFCGGSLIAPGWVLTAAHCVQDETSVGGPHFRVRHGSQTRESGGETRMVKTVYPHPAYVDHTRGDDIALLKLDRPFDVGMDDLVSYVMPSGDRSLTQAETCAVVTGWGSQAATADAKSSRQRGSKTRLNQVDLPIVSTQECRRRYGEDIDERMICAGYATGGKDSCSGDSGGPLVVGGGANDWTIVGVVSYGKGCAEAGGWYGVYTRVSNYGDWIRKTMRAG